MVEQAIVLGHIVPIKGIEVDKFKIDLVRSLPALQVWGRLDLFLVMQDFIENLPRTFQRLLDHYADCSKKEVPFNLDKDCKDAFNNLKDLWTSALIIQPPNWNLPFELMCDASDYAVGAVPGQRVGKIPHAIYYASRTLNDARLNYSTTEKELLSIILL